MAIREILNDSEFHGVLTTKCRPVEQFDARLHEMLDDMGETMRAADGAGLAAPQVGVLRRVAVIDRGGEIVELVNPEILSKTGEVEDLEGCLSFPGLYGMVTRPERVRVRAYDRFGAAFEFEDEGLVARAACHEIDHLDGHIFSELVDRMLTAEEIEAYLEKRDGGETGADDGQPE